MSDSKTPSQPDSFQPSISNADVRSKWGISQATHPDDLALQDLNPGSGDWFEQDKELDLFARLRREDPVHFTPDSQFGAYWSVCNFDDVKYVDTHHEQFSSDIMNGGIRLGGQPMQEPPDAMFHLPMFIMEDQPVHDEQRKVVAPLFTPTKIASMEQEIRTRASAILEDLPNGESFNWVRSVSVELTGQMLATLFDVPQEDRHLLIHWSDTVERISDPNFFETPEEGFAEIWKCFEYFSELWQERKKNPGEDLISFLAHGESTRDMPPNQLLGNVLLLIVGGNDTTRNSMSAGVAALNQNPAEFSKLQSNPALVSNMVPEIIRWQSPVAHMCRTALQDVELGGKQIKKWDKVAIWYLSGNRDATKISDADELRIDRPAARQHLSFGYGIHRCLGNRLAEMQLRVLWEEILQRFSSVEVTGETKYLNSSFIRGITELPTQVTRF